MQVFYIGQKKKKKKKDQNLLLRSKTISIILCGSQMYTGESDVMKKANHKVLHA